MDGFASDNYSGICPEALKALIEANRGPVPSYGDDEHTARATDLLREVLECDCDVYFVFNGTAANSLALASLCQSYHGVICHQSAHVSTDECGGPEFFSNGSKLLPVPGNNGKITSAGLLDVVRSRTDIHFPKPKVLTLTQATEFGTVYSVDELKELAQTAHDCDMHVHMDGARFANAVASLETSPAELSWRAGIDVLCFGGTKMGLPVGEAVVFFDRQLSRDFAWRCKQAGQLASKMRYLSAPWVGMLSDGAWLRHAGHANAMATRLCAGISGLAGVELCHPVEANGVFLRLAPQVEQGLKERGIHFYSFFAGCDARLMCSWDTSVEQVDELIQAFLDVCD